MCCLRYGMVCDAMAPRLSVSTYMYSSKSHHKPSRYSVRPPASFLLPVHIKKSQSYHLTTHGSIGALSRHQDRSHIERASIQVGDNTQNGEAFQGAHCPCVSCVQQKKTLPTLCLSKIARWMKIYSAMALVEVKGTNRRVSGCSGEFNSVSIDTVSVIDTQSTEKLTSVCSKGSAASSFSNTSHRGAFPGGLSVHQGSFLIMNLCQFWSFA